MRKLAEGAMVHAGRSRRSRAARAIKRTMWSRRAQEYEAKINSGDIVADRRGRARPLPRRTRSPSSPTPSASSMRLPSTGCRARSRRCSALTETEAIKEIEAALAKACRARPQAGGGRGRRGRGTGGVARTLSGGVSCGGPAETPGLCLCRAPRHGYPYVDKIPLVSHKLSFI